jgi:hypothetical protein
MDGLTHGRQDIMAPQNESEFQRAARQRWPQYEIYGDGPYALVCSVTRHARLYGFHMLALTDIARDHSNWRCKDEHKLVELKAVSQRAPLTLRNRAAMERD